ncbi:MAG TPA: molybdenum ABC transporter ATP-binding protein [Planctomycetota bacterium]|nr:molybdenum ABC transporter ATP-binding protein [Planctomycetota bacterium]
MNGLEVAVELSQRAFALDVAFRSSARALGVCGPSGSGKTTLLEVLCGWRRPRAGRVALGASVWFDSAARVELAPAARRVGYVPQDLLLFEHLDVRANLLAGARDAARIDGVAELLDLRELLTRRTATLSGGERQRVALGRALCAEPELLLLDEPLASLDVALKRRILAYLVRVREALGTRLVLVSHDPTEVSALCDEVCVLRAGRLVAQGTPGEVFAGGRDVLADGAGYDNVLRGTVVEVGAGAARLDLGAGASLEVPRGELEPGDGALVAVAADDVLVALEAPRGLSARNALPATVARLVERGDEVLVHCDLGGGATLCAELTPSSTRELALAPGRPVVLLIKTRACRLLARLPSAT